MEIVLTNLLAYMISLASGLRESSISEKRKKKLQEELKKHEALIKKHQSLQSLKQHFLQMTTRFAKVESKLHLTENELLLKQLFLDASFLEKIYQWFILPEESDVISKEIINDISYFLGSNNFSPEEIGTITSSFFETLELTIADTSLLHSWRVNLYLKKIHSTSKETNSKINENNDLIKQVLSHIDSQTESVNTVKQNYESQLEDAYRELSFLTSDKFKDIKEDWLKGDRENPVKWIERIKSSIASWDSLTPSLRAEIIKFEALIALQNDDLELGEKLIHEALLLESNCNVSRLNSYVQFLNGNTQAAIDHLLDEKEIPSRELLASYYIENGEFNKSKKIIDDLLVKSGSAETYRLACFLALNRKKIEEAKKHIESAERLKPEYDSILEMRLLVNYCSCFSAEYFPSPIKVSPPFFPRYSKISQCNKFIEQSLTICNKLKKRDLFSKKLNFINLWKLAFLTAHSSMRDELEYFVQELLAIKDLDSQIVAWIINQRSTESFPLQKKFLTNKIESASVELTDLCNLLNILLYEKELSKAEKLLVSNEITFKGKDKEMLDYFSIEILRLQNNGAIDRYRFEQLPSRLKEIFRIDFLCSEISKDNYVQVSNSLLEIYRSQNDYKAIWRALEINALFGNWKFVVDNKSVLDSINSYESRKLLIFSYYHTRKFKEALLLIKSDFHNDQSVMMIKTECEKSLGYLNDAIENSRSLFEKSPSVDTGLAYLNTLIRVGDSSEITHIAEKLVSSFEIGNHNLIFLGNIVSGYDLLLAKKCLEKTSNIPNTLVSEALTLAYKVGSSIHIDSLLPQMVLLAKEGYRGSYTFDKTEIESFVENNRNDQKRIYELYSSGQMPIPFLSRHNKRLSCPELYHFVPSVNNILEEANSTPIFFRHGGRPTSLKIHHKKAILDQSSIIILYRLELLDQINHIFDEVFISPTTIPSLINAKDNYLPHDLPSFKNAVYLCEIREKLTSYDASKEIFSDSLGEEGKIDWRFILINLKREKHLSTEECQKIEPIISDLEGDEPKIPVEIHLDFGVFNTIHSLGLIDKVLDKFKVSIPKKELEYALNYASSSELNKENNSWIDGLINNLKTEISKNRLLILPDIPMMQVTPELHSIEYLLSELDEHSAVIVDDRNLNSYSNFTNKPTYCTIDVLQELLSRSIISEKTFYSKINSLRKDKYQFIPLFEGELYFWLKDSFYGGSLNESESLKIIKKYYSICLIEKNLQKTCKNRKSNPSGEVNFLLNYHGVIEQTIRNIWSDSIGDDKKHYFTSWILLNLYYEHTVTFNITGLSDIINSHEDSIRIRSWVSLIINSALIATVDNESGKKYLRYIWFNFIKVRIDQDIFLLSVLGKQIVRALMKIDFEPSSEAFKSWLLQNSPEQLQSELKKHTEMSSLLTRVVSIEGFTFEVTEVLKAGYEAFSKGSSHVTNRPDGNDIKLTCIDKSRAVLGITKKQKHKQHFPHCMFLSDSNSDHEIGQLMLKNLFDLGFDNRDKFFKDLPHLAPVEIFDRIENLKDNNLNILYNFIPQWIIEGQIKDDDFFPNDISGFYNYLRLNQNNFDQNKVDEQLLKGFTQLVEEKGVVESLRRYSGIPYNYSKKWIDNVIELIKDDIDKVVSRFLNPNFSPVARIQLIHLLANLEDKKYHKLAYRIIRKTFYDEDLDENLSLYGKICSWVYSNFLKWDKSLEVSQLEKRLFTFFHSSHIYSILKENNIRLEWMNLFFGGRNLNREMFFKKGHSYDLSNPYLFNNARMLVSGIVYCIFETEVSENIKKACSKLIAAKFLRKDGEFGYQASPELLNCRGVYTNELNLFWGTSPFRMLDDYLSIPEANFFRYFPPKETIDALLLQLSDECHDIVVWSSLASSLQGEVLNDDQMALFIKLIYKVEFKKIPVHFLVIVCGQLKYLQSHDSNITSHVKDQILTTANFTVVSDELEAMFLFEACYRFSLSASSKAKTLTKIIVDLFEAILKTNHEWQPMVRNFLETLNEILPSKESINVWELLIKSRADLIS